MSDKPHLLVYYIEHEEMYEPVVASFGIIRHGLSFIPDGGERPSSRSGLLRRVRDLANQTSGTMEVYNRVPFDELPQNTVKATFLDPDSKFNSYENDGNRMMPSMEGCEIIYLETRKIRQAFLSPSITCRYRPLREGEILPELGELISGNENIK